MKGKVAFTIGERSCIGCDFILRLTCNTSLKWIAVASLSFLVSIYFDVLIDGLTIFSTSDKLEISRADLCFCSYHSL
jgi:hypothetical protein